jgi:hypothetical protein
MSYMYGCLGPDLYKNQIFRVYLFVFALLLYPNYSNASNFLDDVTVYEEDGVYYISISSEIAARADYVRHVLTDYIHIYRLNDSIIASKTLAPSADNKAQVETTVLCCTTVFCKEVTRVEEVSVLASGSLHTRIVPEKSDFRSGEATWQISPLKETTHLSYQATLEPDFFIPPILGTQLVIKNLREQFSMTFDRIQHIAQINEKREWNENYEFAKKRQCDNGSPCRSTTNAKLR